MRRFALVEPGTIEAAAGALAAAGADGRALAGGIDLLGEMKDGIAEPATLVDLKAIPGLNGIRFEADGALRLGALATLAEVAGHPRVRSEFPAVAAAALSVGSPEIRNVGTVGGNLCQRPRCWYYRSADHPCLKKGGDVCYTLAGESRYHAILGGGPSFIVHPSDLAPALVAAAARVTVAGPRGRKDLLLERFYVPPSVRLDHETILMAGDIVTEVFVPADSGAAAGTRAVFLKFKEKESFDFALASVAASLVMDGPVCRRARVVLGGVAPIPWRAPRAEEVLTGKVVDAAAAARAAESALAEAQPLAHNGYKVPLAKALLARAVLAAAGA